MTYTVRAHLILLLALCFCQTRGLDNGLAKTPPMGWMHWQRYRCNTNCYHYPDDCVSEDLFKRQADLLVSEGYTDVGYDYVIVDDCWLESERDRISKKLLPDHKRFANGIKHLADYIHDKGLKFGLYQNYGTHTCEGYPGIMNHMELDANTFAEWGVDYVKIDACYSDSGNIDEGYPEFGRLLNQTGRPMVYSCSWPYYKAVKKVWPNYEQVKKYCNLWRYYADAHDSFSWVKHSIDYIQNFQDKMQPNAGPGNWNDPDMLLLGNYGLSYDQSRVQMAFWAILAAPLIMSNNLGDVRPEIKELLQNRDIIAVNQDRLGIQGQHILKKDEINVWSRPIEPINKAGKYSYAIAFVNFLNFGGPKLIRFSLNQLGLGNKEGYMVEDLFDSKSLGKYLLYNGFYTRINPSGVMFYKFTPI